MRARKSQTLKAFIEKNSGFLREMQNGGEKGNCKVILAPSGELG